MSLRRCGVLVCSVLLIFLAVRGGFANAPAEENPFAAADAQILTEIREHSEDLCSDDPTMSLSRGDYKVCHAVITEEVERAGFLITGVQTIGRVNTVGGFGIYTLQRRY